MSEIKVAGPMPLKQAHAFIRDLRLSGEELRGYSMRSAVGWADILRVTFGGETRIEFCIYRRTSQ